MTGPFQYHPPAPDLQNFPECDFDGHLRGHNGGEDFSRDEGSERDGGEGYGIYVPFEARKGKGTRERTQVSISNRLDLSPASAANWWPRLPETVRTLPSALCDITPYIERVPFLYSLVIGIFTLPLSDKCRPAD